MVDSGNANYVTIYEAIIGFSGIAIGAAITGIISIYRDDSKFKKEKLSTAYAFKGEIQSLLEIIETRKLKESLVTIINNKELFLKYYAEQLKNTNNNNLDSLHNLANLHEVSFLYPFYISVNKDLFLVKYTFKDKIGLLDNSVESVIKFYQYVNVFLLDIEYNKIKINELDAVRAKARSAADPMKVIKDYYDKHNIIGEVENDIVYHKTILEVLTKVIEYGEECIKSLNKFIESYK
jgi:hypothetical protein